MATTNPPPPAPRSRPRTQQPPPDTGRMLYFAYGSNLHVAQMAERCPDSLFMGKATLPGYTWQINQRGVANVVESGPSYCVKGLVYAVTPRDRRALDRSEGVSKEFYLPHMLTVEFQAHDVLGNSESSELARKIEARYRDVADPDVAGRDRHFRANSEVTRKVKALIYVSEKFKDPGPPRPEYVLRMKRGVADAKALGVSRTFLNEAIMPILNTPREYTWVTKGGSNSQTTPQSSDRTPARRRADPTSGRPETVPIEPRSSRPAANRQQQQQQQQQPTIIPVQPTDRRRDGARVLLVEPTRRPQPGRAGPADRLALEVAEREQAELEQARERYERRWAREEPLPGAPAPARESGRERRAREAAELEAAEREQAQLEEARDRYERRRAREEPLPSFPESARQPERQSARKTNNGGGGSSSGSSEQPERPTIARKANNNGSGGSGSSEPSERPATSRKANNGNGNGNGSSNADQPDRPNPTRKATNNGKGNGNGGSEQPQRASARKAAATTTTTGETTTLPSRPRQQAGNDGAQT